MELNKCGCGGEANLCHSLKLGKCIGVYRRCTCCGNSTGLCSTRERADQEWNTAHPKAIRLDDVREMVEAVRWSNLGICSSCGYGKTKCTTFEKKYKCAPCGVTIEKLTAYVGAHNG